MTGHGIQPWEKFRDSQDGPGKRKESRFYMFFMVLFFVFLSEFTFVCTFFMAEGNMGPSIPLPLGRV